MVLRDHPHLDDVLISGEKLHLKRLDPSQRLIRGLAAYHGSTGLEHLQLVDPTDWPGQRVMDSWKGPLICNTPKPGDYSLLVGGNHIDAREQIERDDSNRHSLAARRRWAVPELNPFNRALRRCDRFERVSNSRHDLAVLFLGP